MRIGDALTIADPTFTATTEELLRLSTAKPNRRHVRCPAEQRMIIDCKEYTSFGTDVDLVADGPGANTPAKRLEVIAVGASPSLVVVTQNNTTRTLVVTAGQVIRCAIRTIKPSADITRVRAFWSDGTPDDLD
jgi:hypothetical protein